MRKSSVIYLFLFFLLIIPFVNYYIISLISSTSIFHSFASVPEYEIIMVPGAGRLYPNGRTNYAFMGRMEAAVKLGSRTSCKTILLSGRNIPPHYNETEAMREYLVNKVDTSKIITDTSGYNTFRSLDNYRKRFGKTKVILVSQQHHLERMLFISRFIGIDAAGYAAEKSPRSYFFREVLSRMKMWYDLLIQSKN